jgi:hypothetical protein
MTSESLEFDARRRNRWLKIKVRIRARRRRKTRRKISNGLITTIFNFTLKKLQGKRNYPGAFCFSL